jgi:proteasome accessory factor A
MTRPQYPTRVPKLCGADIELGNFIVGANYPNGSAAVASRTLLAELRASEHCAFADARVSTSGNGYNPQDWGRSFLKGAQCCYLDLDHVECCVQEALSAWDHVACWHAMLRIMRDVLRTANARRHDGSRLELLANNSDGRDHAYGSHTNFLLTRTAWNNLFDRKMHHLLWLAAFQTSSIVYTGAGKVGSENGAPPVAFQLAQRADFFETLVGEQTTHRRPIVNSRDEALCGTAARAEAALARLHCIFFDNTLCHGSTLLKIGTMQIVLAMLEAEQINPELLLDDPVAAVGAWSHDPSLQRRARMADGTQLSAVELQLRFLEDAERFVAAGGCRDIVPRAAEILALWQDTLAKLRANELTSLAGRLDWVLRFTTIQRALLQRPALTWHSPQIKHLDFLYSSLADDGLYWQYEDAGIIEPVVSPERIARFVDDAPDDTRAWTRAKLLQTAPALIDGVGWDVVRVRLNGTRGWPVYRSVHLANPLAFTRAQTEAAFEQATSLDELLDLLDAAQAEIDTTPTLYGWH